MGSGLWSQPPPGFRCEVGVRPPPVRLRCPSASEEGTGRWPCVCHRASLNRRLPCGPTTCASRVSAPGTQGVLRRGVACLPDREVLKGPRSLGKAAPTLGPPVAGAGRGGGVSSRQQSGPSASGGWPGGVTPGGPGEARLGEQEGRGERGPGPGGARAWTSLQAASCPAGAASADARWTRSSRERCLFKDLSHIFRN